MGTEKHDLKRKRRGPITLVLVVAAVGILSLGVLTVLGTPEQSADNAVGAKREADAAGVAIALDVQRIEPADGPAFVLTLGAMAPADGSATLRFNSGHVYDFVVSQDGRELWRWSDGRAFHQAVFDHTVDAGTLQTFVEVWDGRDGRGQLVTGSVTVQASLQTNPVMETNIVAFTIDTER